MLQKHSILRAGLRKYFLPSALATAALLVGNATWAGDNSQGGDDRAVRLIKVIPVPPSSDNNTGGLYSWDISWVDQKTQTYYVADRSNASVDIVDAANPGSVTQLKASPSFAGISPPAFLTGTAGPDGVVTGGHCLFVTDAPSRVVSFDTTSFPPTQVSDVHTATPTANRADELAYDPKDKLLLVINNADTPPFGTFIKVNPASCVLTPPTSANKITLDAAHGVDATNGAEQPVWEPRTGRFYLSIPQIGPPASSLTVNANGGVVRIAPNATSVEAIYPVQYCGPAGLTVGPRQDLFIGCNTVFDTAGDVWVPGGTVTAAPQDVIIDARTGKKDKSVLDASVLGVGPGDEVWYNSGDGNYYATGSGSPFRPLDTTTPPADARGATPLGIVSSIDQKIVQQLVTYNVPATTSHAAGTAHSVAANAANNYVFVPLGANNAFSAFAAPGDGPVDDCQTGCIAVFGR